MNTSLYFYSFVACLTSAFFFSPGHVKAQKPNSQTQPGAGTESIATKPVAYSPTTAVNSIRVWEATKPFATEADIVSTDNTLDEVKQTTQYFDGLGRPIQTVSKGSSPLGFDIITLFLYDAYGRERLKYLPYISSGHSDGTFKLNPFQEQEDLLKTFYNPGNASGANLRIAHDGFHEGPIPGNIRRSEAQNSGVHGRQTVGQFKSRQRQRHAEQVPEQRPND